MKILHIKAGDTSFEDERRFLDLAYALEQIGVKQHIVMNPAECAEHFLTQSKISFEIQKFGGIFDLRTLKAIQSAVVTFSPHIIQIHSPDAAMMAAKLDHKALRIGFLNEDTVHDSKIKSCTDAGFIVSYATDRKHQDSKIFYVPPLVYNICIGTPDVSREQFGTPDDKPLIGTMIDLSKTYELDKIFPAIKEISGLHLWIMGTGPDKKHFENEARKQAIHDKVRIIEECGKWPALFGLMDLCIVPYRKNGVDRMTLEAWACSKAVISAMPFGNTPVTDNQDGWILAANDRIKWREQITDALSNPEKLGQIGQQGRQAFKQSYAPETLIKSYLQSYESALQTK